MAGRGLAAGGSLEGDIVVNGKPVDRTFKQVVG